MQRGFELTDDDLVRRAVIQPLMCDFELSPESFGRGTAIASRSASRRNCALAPLAADGLVEIRPEWIV